MMNVNLTFSHSNKMRDRAGKKDRDVDRDTLKSKSIDLPLSPLRPRGGQMYKFGNRSNFEPQRQSRRLFEISYSRATNIKSGFVKPI